MKKEMIPGKVKAAAIKNIKEKEYWMQKLSGELKQSSFPYDYTVNTPGTETQVLECHWPTNFLTVMEKVSGGSHNRLFMILLAGLVVLLEKYTGIKDVIVGIPIFKQDRDGPFINTILAVRNIIEEKSTFKGLLLKVKESVIEADEYCNFPIQMLMDQFDIPESGTGFSLFDVVLSLENIHYQDYQMEVLPAVTFTFSKSGNQLKGTIEFKSSLYKKSTIERIFRHFVNVLSHALTNVENEIAEIECLDEQEKQMLLFDFNDTLRKYPDAYTLERLFENQVKRTPLHTAAVYEDHSITYEEMNRQASRLARLLSHQGVRLGSIVGIMIEPSIDMIVGLMAILKAGGAYLPIDLDFPVDRVQYMLDNSGALHLLSNSRNTLERGFSFTRLMGLENHKEIKIKKTTPREHIAEFDKLPIPDRSLINKKNYKNKIGMASVVNFISIQATRGCPYRCIFCHKLWSKHHVFRSAANIFDEINYYYKKGVRNFSFIDDCFNLDRKNSRTLYELLIKSNMDVQLFFPNGLRGDILTPSEIDLMVEAGTRGINLSLETASPRLQKLLKKNLDIEKFKINIDYIAECCPGVILEIATMHGFPTETEDEAMMTLNFIKDIKWLHFPYIHILKIYPNTEMEALALAHGISKEDILKSKDLAYHQLPETLPFSKSFTRQYQSDFLNNYFLSKERLHQVLPVQMRIMTEKALVDKYNAYLPAEITSLADILDFTGMADIRISNEKINRETPSYTIFDLDYTPPAPPVGAKKILLLDLSRHFTSHSMLYNVSEQPLGLISLLTYLKQQLGDKVDGRIYKAAEDFDNFDELEQLVKAYKPDLIGIRTLTFYKEFFHQTISLLRHWGVTVPVITGGPYATSDYNTIIKDKNVDLVVLGEGEYTFAELVQEMFNNEFSIPGRDILNNINGIIYRDMQKDSQVCRDVILYDAIKESLLAYEPKYPDTDRKSYELAYVMYTSGSTGRPKGVMVEHRNVSNCIHWMQDVFKLKEKNVVVQRTNLTFDPSVWEIFWPLQVGASVRVLDSVQRKDAVYLVELLLANDDITVMYCPAALINAMAQVLELKAPNSLMKLSWLISGAEPISMKTVKNIYPYLEGKLVNTYGPTEAAINNTYYDIPREENRAVVPIGRPIANNKIYILSPGLKLQPVKLPGEICIAGASVARGYISNKSQTDESFIPNPFGPGKLYKTGDIGRWIEDGNIEIMGRQDDQVKIRGHRIELGEIKSALQNHPQVRESLVIALRKEELQEEIRECSTCGIWSNYPGISINEENTCNICENLEKYQGLIDRYFLSMDDLKHKIEERNKNKAGKYDCLLVYACERVATYALYKLVEMGFNVMTVTYDSGHYDQTSLDRITGITRKIGVDHTFLRHLRSDDILKTSLRVAQTMCKGCIHTSSALAAQYAYENDIPIVIGETLSRGQIVENKLYKFMEMGVFDVDEIQREIDKLQRNVALIDKQIFDIINIDKVKDGSVYDKVEFIDFYRYCDITHDEMVKFLDAMDPYWKNLETSAIYSTDCKICTVGNFNHLKEKGYHYTGSAKSWDKRLGLATMDEVKNDLEINLTSAEHVRFLRELGYEEAKSDDNNEKFLCAYIVSDNRITSAQLRKYLEGEVPEYMIPTYFIQIDHIPLTSNGKVDRKSLPLPALSALETGEEYAAASSPIEEKMVEIWELVLGRNTVGVNDNFFQIGGDSIKTIQIVSRMNQAGLKIEMKEIFLKPTIAQLAPTVKKVEKTIDQSVVSGMVPLNPVQHHFFEKVRHRKHHFNQAVMFFSRNGFEEKAVRSIFDMIQKHHDALRMTYKEENGKVVQTNHGLDYPLSLDVIDLRGQDEKNGLLEKHANQLQASINLESGPMMKLGLFQMDDGDHLLVVIHHLVVDGVSWRILCEDIEYLYKQFQDNESLRLPFKTDSFKQWSERLSLYADSPVLLEEKEYWGQMEKVAASPIQKDFDRRDNRVKDADKLLFRFSKEKTQLLLTKVNHALTTEINDILLTAVGLAVKRTWKINQVAIVMEGHGREEILPNVDISRTVGWFTTQYPVLLNMSFDNDLSRQIKEIKESLRLLPKKGIGYGILKYLTSKGNKEDIQFVLEPQILFNYLGQFNAGIESNTFGVVQEASGYTRNPGEQREYELEITGMITNNQLSMSVVYSREQYKIGTMKTFMDNLEIELAGIVSHCSQLEYTELTPSDLTFKGLSIEALEKINRRYPLEDIFQLTPMQEGMLFHSLYKKNNPTYFQQISYKLQGKLDVGNVEKSLNLLFERYDVLRVAFILEGVDHPLQVIVKDRKVEFHFEDLRSSGPGKEETRAYIEEYKIKDRQRSFDLSRDVLMRVSVLQADENLYEFIWSYHHILMDGWCSSLLISEFSEIYTSFLEKRPARLAPVQPFRAYIQWLQQKDRDSSRNYWKNYLDGYKQLSSVPRKETVNSIEVGYKKIHVCFELDNQMTVQLTRLAGKHHLTLNTVLQTVWGLLLMKYNHVNDVVFSATVSGRPPEIEGVERTVGLFINTTPVRVTVDRQMPFRDLLKKVWLQAVESESHHHYPLSAIQADSPLKDNLLNNNFVFDNYPLVERIKGNMAKHKADENTNTLKISGIDVFEQTNYDFSLLISPGEQLHMEFVINANVYDHEFVRRIPNHFTRVLEQILENDEAVIDNISIFSHQEEKIIRVDLMEDIAGLTDELEFSL